MGLKPANTKGTERLVDDLTLRYLPNTSHWVQQDAPEEVNAIPEAWLTGKPVPGNEASAHQLRKRARHTSGSL